MKNKKFIKTIFNVLIFSTITLIAGNVAVFARSSAEIGKDIEDQQKVLEQNKKDLETSKQNLDYFNNALAQSEGGLPQVEAQIKQIEAQIGYNNQQLSLLNENKKLKELEKAQREVERQESIKSSYMDWRSKSNSFVKVLDTQKDYDFKKSTLYSNLIVNNQQKNILGLTSQLQVISGDIEDYETQKTDLDKTNADLVQKKQDLENQIALYSSAIGYTSNNISSLENGIVKAQNTISLLSQEQKSAFQQEAELAAQSGTGGVSIGGCVTSDDGNNDNTIQFCGIGNDFVQGHQVGMSQWGAHGMANHGFRAQDIVQFYYTGVQLSGGYEDRTVNVEGYGNINVEDYVAGQGEVPGRACGTQDQVNQNPSKYALYNGSSWSCWPEEAIKAQAIAYRTYGLYYSGFLHADARSQVYNGSHYTQWAADETRGQVLIYGGSVIEALYSADNNQGFGTANNDTIFQNFDGGGSVVPYLRAVNDNSYATYTSYTNWGFRSKNYTMDDIFTMMQWTAANDGGGFGSFVQGLINQLGGKPTKISFVRDPSFRVSRVNLENPSGTRVVMGAWWFTYMYNVYNSRHSVTTPEGEKDWLWSQTFFVHVR